MKMQILVLKLGDLLLPRTRVFQMYCGFYETTELSTRRSLYGIATAFGLVKVAMTPEIVVEKPMRQQADESKCKTH